ncbi:MAG: PLP-dependent aminotransferase family protein [Anaerococcus sp.]
MYIQFNDKDFLYKQVYDHIRSEIIRGKLKYGDKLPSIRSLSSKMNISNNTVENAYYQLDQEGFIKSIEKSGFYVEKIDQLLLMEKDQTKEPIKKSKDSYAYDFSFGGVDKDCFNFSYLKKAFKSAIIEDDTFLENNKGLGDESLRSSIANYLYSSRGIDVNKDQILISAGSSELFDLLSSIFYGKNFAFENPGYAYRNFGPYKYFKSFAFGLDKEGIEIKDLDNKNIDIVSVTPAHQFPLTTIMSIKRRTELLNWAYKNNDRYIIEDDYDAEFKYKLMPITPLKVLDINDRVIYMGNFSRVITPALRISYMVLPEKILEKNKDFFDSYISPASLFSQRALAQYIDQGFLEKQINKSKKSYEKKYTLIKKILKKEEKIRIISTDSGTSFVIRLDESLDYKEFEKKIKNRKINLPKINDFAYKKVGFEGMYLLGFAKLSEEEISNGLREIIKIVNSL